MTRENFYQEVLRRQQNLEVSLDWMKVVKWCSDRSNVQQLEEVCDELEVLLQPPVNHHEEDKKWRRDVWAHLEERRPLVIKQLLKLSGGAVLKNRVQSGELYSGAVFCSLLKGWQKQYGSR